MGIQEAHEGQTILSMIGSNIIAILVSLWVMINNKNVCKEVK